MSIENVIGLVALVGLGIVVGLAYRKWKESKSTPVREPIILTPTPLPKSIAPKKKAVATKVAPTKAAKKAAPVAKYAAKKTIKKPAAKRK